MEHGPFIDDFPIKTSIYKGFSMAMLNNQRVTINFTNWVPWLQTKPPFIVMAWNQLGGIFIVKPFSLPLEDGVVIRNIDMKHHEKSGWRFILRNHH